MRQFVTSGEGLPQWASPISHAVVVDNMCYLSGQLSIDGEGNYVAGTPAQEAQRAFDNLFRALAAAGFEPADLSSSISHLRISARCRRSTKSSPDGSKPDDAPRARSTRSPRCHLADRSR